MDSLHLTIALVPLAVYLLLLGLINLSPRPFLTTGIRDGMALALGLSGLFVAGPLELFLPERAASVFGPFVWILLIGLYLLGCTLLVLMGRPRLVIYNTSATDLRPLLEAVVRRLDPQATSAGDTFVLPQLYVQLHLEDFPALRNVSLVSIGPKQSWLGWRKLEQELAAVLRESSGVANPYGVLLVAMGLAIGAITTYGLLSGRQDIATALWEMLRF
jgi:hypothetical protein